MNIQMISTSGLSSESQNWMFMVVLLIMEFQIILFLSKKKKYETRRHWFYEAKWIVIKIVKVYSTKLKPVNDHCAVCYFFV